MDRQRVIIADESLYKTWIGLGLDVSDMELIEKKFGAIIATNEIADNILKWLRRTLSSPYIIVWSKTIKSDNDKYLKLVQKYSPEITQTFSSIKSDTKNLLKLLHTFDKGASFTDVSLLANARWIGLNTPFEPVIVTEDRDLLGFGHIISSYLGLPFSFLSLFEILRTTDMQHTLPSYFQYCKIPLKTAIEIGQHFSPKDLERDINALVRKTKIAFHPTLRRKDNIRRITRQIRRPY